MSQYRAYPAYKDSGVEWIGQVPEHWKVARIKRLASLRNERRNDVSTDTIYIGLEDVEAGSGQYKPTNGSSRQSEDSTVGIFYEGDVLYGKLRPYLRKAIVSEMAGCCSTEFLVLMAEKTEPRWLQEWLLTPDVTHQIESGCEGAKMPRADWWHIGSIEVVYPDQPERAQILTTLDRETARIDALIEKKTRFIELLKEKRQALITHAVTKGLDPNVKMKDSGVEWIGQVPEHWEVVPSTWLFVESKERAHEDDQHLSATQKYGVISLADYERLEGRQVTHAVKNLEQRKHVELDDFVISMRSFQGGIERVKALGCVRSSYVVIQAGDGADKNYFAYLFKSGSYIQGLQATSSFIRDGQDLNYGNFRQVRLPKPGSDEQMQIAKFLDQETARIDALTRTTEQSITLLKERRAAFITAAVTGQIDLRGKQ
ncbi:restriction endonuclease subunit S (plasmid) [Enterobacter hormaechei]|uniref:restriction endonuclease subunit S n=1 Tax=Enterobacter hormaechei TaxID=158836 RepID=UPI00281248F5|nr:restriction endonuclease subunit S [Enterobacter hormaechei]WMQ89727.1 restriction endonuclease subunit S [Enterobacter hormaechei]